ncbi:unnamed protein product [Toxocara canis]|uniref:Haloacid dehalogenase-like hydrolase domain-containing protein 3 n=1 Tax=Toxocara canis TaxID=6265 RepID=A0A183V2T6_TOXCA|nr:unnamed protein product [Toxocara canis]
MSSITRSAIRLLTLDAMDTLIRIPKSVGEVYADFAQKFGVNCDAAALTTAFRNHFQALSVAKPCYGFAKDGSYSWWTELIRNCFEDIGAISKFVRFDDFSKQLFEHFGTTAPWQLIDAEAHEHITRLRSKGIHIGVISNFDSRLRSVLDGFELLPLIDLMLLSGEVGLEKPDARLFRVAANRFELSSMDELLHVGDSFKRDYEGARAAGAKALLFVRPSSNESPSPLRPEMIIHSLWEVARYL